MKIKAFATLFILSLSSFYQKTHAIKGEFDSCTLMEIKNIEASFNNIKTLTADIIENSEDGSVKTGKIFIKKPGRLKIEYDNPKISIYINNNHIIYYDRELEESSELSKNNSYILNLLSKNNLNFRTANIVSCRLIDNLFYLTFNIDKKDVNKTATFVIMSSNFNIYKLIIEEDEQLYKEILFKDIKYDIGLGNDIFEFQDRKFFEIEE